MGAWIEILTFVGIPPVCSVAPLVGAWIEISVVFQSQLCACVAPLVGAWIEISQNNYVVEAVKGRSPRGSVD